MKSSRVFRSNGRRVWLLAGVLAGFLLCDQPRVPLSAAQPTASHLFQTVSNQERSVSGAADVVQISALEGADGVFGPLTPSERSELTALYELTGAGRLWTDAAGRLNHQARQFLELLQDARDDGLDPAAYRAPDLERMAAAVNVASLPVTTSMATDVALSRASLRYFRDLHLGRIDPRTIGFHLKVAVEAHDFVALVRSALAGDRIAETAAELRPALGQYETLRGMLRRYRALADDARLAEPLPATAVLHPGDPYAGVQTLFRRLEAFGDVPTGVYASAGSDRYEGPLVDAVSRFQRRHGLEPDGVLGRDTQAALQTSVAWRVRQIELALERLRWLPDLDRERVLAINIPMFRLWSWDSMPPDSAPTLAMDVIVGRALRTQTPIIDVEMRDVVFRPYWNIPRSILVREILPVLKRDTDYLRQQNMEIVRGTGDEAEAVDTTAENLALLRAGQLRVRQRPGAKNALGLVKFVFPNQQGVYMHGTPAQALFGRNRRDFSHGCVRVQDPAALAEWVLQERPEWSRDRILSAMAGSETLHVRLPRPIRVILFYTTAAVMPEDGLLHFADDIYGHDTTLDRALARPSFP